MIGLEITRSSPRAQDLPVPRPPTGGHRTCRRTRRPGYRRLRCERRGREHGCALRACHRCDGFTRSRFAARINSTGPAKGTVSSTSTVVETHDRHLLADGRATVGVTRGVSRRMRANRARRTGARPASTEPRGTPLLEIVSEQDRARRARQCIHGRCNARRTSRSATQHAVRSFRCDANARSETGRPVRHACGSELNPPLNRARDKPRRSADRMIEGAAACAGHDCTTGPRRDAIDAHKEEARLSLPDTT